MKDGKKIAKSVSMIMQIGISMLVPILLCVFIGVQLDRLFDTGFITIIMIVLGFGAAFRNVYILTKSFYHKDMIIEEQKRREEAEKKAAEEEEALQRKAEREEAFRRWKESRGE